MSGFEHVEFAVTHETRVLNGVTCVVIHDTSVVNGVPHEDTLDFFAQDLQGNVWYFGEATHEFVDGLILNIGGTFLSGRDGAKPGIVMKAHPTVGDYYRQESDLGNAEDIAEVLSLNASASTPYGNFANALQTKETTPLEPSLVENKFYAAGVGQVLTFKPATGESVPLVRVVVE